jgi:hypothetical protein
VNGAGIEIIVHYPFAVSCELVERSNHSYDSLGSSLPNGGHSLLVIMAGCVMLGF